MKDVPILKFTPVAILSLVTAVVNVFAALPTTQTEITPNTVADFQQFGYAVAIDGDTAVVGAPLDPAAGSAGAAYVFVRNGSTWSEQAVLTASDARPFAEFGIAAAISGNTIVIGAHADGADGEFAGAAYVFVRNGTTWTEQAALRPADAAANKFYGAAVTIDGDTVAIGAPGDAQGGSGAGAAYVFTRSGTSWTQEAKLLSAIPEDDAALGRAMSLDGDTLAVGSPFDDDGLLSNSGAVLVFTRNGSAWSQQAELRASDALADDGFGIGVALSGDMIVAGAPQHQGMGAAYVFARSGGAWAQEAMLQAGDAEFGAVFGFSVALDGNAAAIGASLDSSFAFFGGSVYLFQRNGGVWIQEGELSANVPADMDQFGLSVALSGSTIVAGAPFRSDTESGAAYIFSSPPINSAPVAESQAVAVNEDTSASITLAASDADGDALTFSVLTQPTMGTLSGAAPNLTYTPTPDENGADSFTFTVNDGTTDSAPATVTITVNAVNDPPTIADVPDQAGDANASIGPVAFTVGDMDNDVATLIVSGSSSDTELIPSGNVVINGTGVNRNVTVIPAADKAGTATITVTVTDGALTATDMFIVTFAEVLPPSNGTPVADASATPVEIIAGNNKSARVRLDGSRSVDPDGDKLAYAWFKGSNLTRPIATQVRRTVVLNVGTHTITLVVNDGQAEDADTIKVTVISVSRAIDRLADQVRHLDIPRGLKKDILSNLEQASRDAKRGNEETALKEMRDAVRLIDNATPRRIDRETSKALLKIARQIIVALQNG